MKQALSPDRDDDTYQTTLNRHHVDTPDTANAMRRSLFPFTDDTRELLGPDGAKLRVPKSFAAGLTGHTGHKSPSQEDAAAAVMYNGRVEAGCSQEML